MRTYPHAIALGHVRTHAPDSFAFLVAPGPPPRAVTGNERPPRAPALLNRAGARQDAHQPCCLCRGRVRCRRRRADQRASLTVRVPTRTTRSQICSNNGDCGAGWVLLPCYAPQRRAVQQSKTATVRVGTRTKAHDATQAVSCAINNGETTLVRVLTRTITITTPPASRPTRGGGTRGTVRVRTRTITITPASTRPCSTRRTTTQPQPGANR